MDQDKNRNHDAEHQPRWKRLLASNLFRAAVVVVCAAIIFGAWAFAQRTEGGTPRDDVALVLDADDYYEQARQAAESGDTDAAIELLAKALAEDPDHELAAALMRRLTTVTETPDEIGQDSDDPDNGVSPAPGNDASNGSVTDPPADLGPRDDSDYQQPIADLRTLLPQVIEGWRRGIPVVSDTDATVGFRPDSPGSVSNALFAVHDRGSEQAAREFIDSVSKVAYSQDGSQVRVGVVDAYFGTDGTRFATVAFSRGRFAFEMIATVTDGKPAAAKNELVVLAGEFEATR